MFAAALAVAGCSVFPDSVPRAQPTASADPATSGGATDPSAGTSTPSTTVAITDGGSNVDAGAGTSPANGAAKPSCKYTAHQTGLNAYQQAGGLGFHVYAPAAYDPNVGHTVVVLMHGQDSDGTAELQTLWQPIADAEGLVVVAPHGSGGPSTAGAPPNAFNWRVADLSSIQDLIGEIDDCYDVFTKKHILWGFSEGAFYGYLLGIAAATQFSGLAMGGANTSFARQSGYSPSSAPWKVPVSDVHGDQDQNPIALTREDKADFEAAGHVFTLHEFAGGHSISPEQVRSQYDDLKASTSP